MITAAPGVRARASASRASSESSADSATTTASGAPDAAGTDPAARASSASPITKIVGSFLASATIRSIAAASSARVALHLVPDAGEGVHHQQAARARAPESGQPLDVRAQERVDLGQRARQHRRDLAAERGAAAVGIARR